jgi:iron complex transport system ATP-binding protein
VLDGMTRATPVPPVPPRAPEAPPARLRLEAVRHAYGARLALDGVEVSVAPGEFAALVGPNGAGKTTLLRVAAGLLAPSSGRVLLDGADLARLDRRRLARRVGGVAAAEESPFPFTVAETVLLGRHPWRGRFGPPSEVDRAAVEGALRATGLQDLASRPLPTLSTGERQRAALARALAQDPDVLLLDEPTAHLDLGQRLRTLAVLRRAAARGKCILAAFHDLSLAALAADRLVLLVAGRVVASGPPGDVLTRDRMREAFGAEVDLVPHPRTGTPVVVPVAEAGRP